MNEARLETGKKCFTPGIGYSGGFVGGPSATSPRHCLKLCRESDTCKLFYYNGEKCWLKTLSYTGTYDNPNAVSGFIDDCESIEV